MGAMVSSEVEVGGMTDRKNVVAVGVDGSDSAATAALWGAAWAHRHGASLRLVHAFLIHADNALGGVHAGAVLFDSARAAGEKLLTELQAEIRQRFPQLAVEVSLRSAPPGQVLTDVTAEAALTVLGAGHRGRVGELLLGSVATHAAEHGHGPVVVLRENAAATPVGGPVVVGVDAARPSAPALDFAFETAAQQGVPVVAVSVWDDARLRGFLHAVPLVPDEHAVADQQRQDLVQALEPWTTAHPDVVVRPLAVTGHPDSALVAVAEKADASMLVVGSRGLGGLSGLLLDSVSRSVLHQAERPVAVVQNKG